MAKIMAKITIGLLVVLSVVAYILWNRHADDSIRFELGSDENAVSLDEILPRLAELEAQIQYERNRRVEMEEMLESLLAAPDASENVLIHSSFVDANEPGVVEQRQHALKDWVRQQNSGSNQAWAFEKAGFSSDRAQWLLQRESQLQINDQYNRWNERREAYLADPTGMAEKLADPMRAELSGQDYERYLVAKGRPTAVRVAKLIDGTTANRAGIQTGDEITRYDGKRIYNMDELDFETVQGEQGELVTVEVIRGGHRMELTLDRGPLGIVSRNSPSTSRFDIE